MAVEFDDMWPFPTAATDPAAGLSLRDGRGSTRKVKGSHVTQRWRGESRANPSLETPRNSARIRRKRDRLSVADGPIMAFYSRLLRAREATGTGAKASLRPDG